VLKNSTWKKKIQKNHLFFISGSFAQRFAGRNGRKILPSVGNIALVYRGKNKLLKVKTIIIVEYMYSAQCV
jgi:hypothetical protein